MNNADVVPALNLRELSWRKPLRSLANGECVETASLSGRIAVRDSKNPDGVVLSYSADAWRSFLHGAKKGHHGPLG